MTKIYGSLNVERSLSFDEQLFQSTVKHNVATSSPTTIDFNNGNYQTFDLGSGVSSGALILTNYHSGVYAIAIKQHTVQARNVSFSASHTVIADNFNFYSVDLGQTVVVYIIFTGNELIVTSSLNAIQSFSGLIQYKKNQMIYYDDGQSVDLYIAKSNTPATNFSLTYWRRLTATIASKVAYSDPYNTGNSNVESALNTLLGSPRFIAASYLSIDELLLGNPTHNDYGVYFVENVSSGNAADTRVRTGWVIYLKTEVTTGSVTDYIIISAQSLQATEIAFNNNVARLQEPTVTVQNAIEKLKIQIDQLLLGIRFIDEWNAVTNTPFIANTGKYDDDTFNVTVTSIDVINQKVQVPYTSSTFYNSIRLTNYVKINDITFKVTAKQTVLSGTAIDITIIKHDNTAFIEGDISIGQRIYVPNASAPAGNYYIITNFSETSSENVMIDGVNTFASEDKLISNAIVWKHIPQSLTTTASEVSYDNTQEDWQGASPTNVQEALDVLISRINADSTLRKQQFSINVSTSVGGNIHAIEALTGIDAGLTRYTIMHNYNVALYDLIVDIYFTDGSTYEKVLAIIKQSTVAEPLLTNNFADIILETPTASEQYVITIRTE